MRRALQTIGRYLPTMVDSTVYGLDIEGRMAYAYSYYIDPLLMTYRQKNDWGVAFVCNVIRHGLGEPDWAPAEVLLPLAAESEAARHERMRLLRAKVRHGQAWAGIRFDAAVLERPMKTADAMIERLMRHYGDLRLAGLRTQRDELEGLRRSVAQLVVEGDSSVERLAQRLRVVGADVAKAPCRQRLELLGSARPRYERTLALNLLENPSLGIAQIAYCLGYSEVSTFNHAFRRWVGQAPRDYRNSRKPPAGPGSH